MVAVLPIKPSSSRRADVAPDVAHPEKTAGVTRSIADFARSASFATAGLTADDLAALAAYIPRGTRIYVVARPTRSPIEVIDIAVRLAAAGFRDFLSLGDNVREQVGVMVVLLEVVAPGIGHEFR